MVSPLEQSQNWLADGTAPTDGVNKKTVDTEFNLAIEDMRHENKRYVDPLILATNENIFSKAMHFDGTTIPTQDISWGNHKLTNLKNPTQGHDTVNKRYLDYLLNKKKLWR